LDFSVKANVRCGESINGESLALGFGEPEEAADMVILVITREKTFGFGARESKSRKSDWLTKITSVGTVETNQFAQRHDGGAASGFGAHGVLLSGVYCGHERKRRN